ncbi:hypothetical protein [Chitinivorax sp. B]|uniref:hypothetical protein n=1 Tax=Chitinivorax sp. B TaxID=2502235 RepID=UPI0010F905CA|nr:hypothetical protein [Chitinivorax sp. B]
MWAVDQGAARRAIYQDVEADSGALAVVPHLFLPGGCSATFEALLNKLIMMDTAGCQVAAKFRRGDRAFINRMIDSRAGRYFFRGESGLLDVPYAAIRNLTA